MTLVRYGQAAMIAAMMTLTGNTVWAQSSLHAVAIGETSECGKEGQCCKEGESCAVRKKCSTKGACCKDKTLSAKAVYGCPFLNKLAKQTAIIMVMPGSLPLPVSCCLEAMGLLPHPPLPPVSHVLLPQPVPMMGPIPSAPLTVAPVPSHLPTADDYYPPSPCLPGGCNDSMRDQWTRQFTLGDTVVTCSITKPAAAAAQVRITAKPSSNQLEMSLGEGTCICCKKMTITIGHKEIAVSRFDDRVRIRGDELKATAASLRTEGKDHLVLEGDVVLHYKKDGRTAHVTGERVELNLSNSAMTIQRTAKTTVTPAVLYDKND